MTVTTGRARRATRSNRIAALDPIELEVLRNRLEAIAEDAATTIEHTAISPIVTESKDYSATLLDADGNLVAGGGLISYHFVAATNAIRSTVERYGDTIAPGDVFLANDPYNGGGLHPGDVFVQRPVFVGSRRIAWAALSAHLIDIGGLVVGSFAPAATDCYQEGIRVPPVRLFRQGEEVTEVWDIFRTNVRIAMLVEMDLRGLVAGSYVAEQKVMELVESAGVDVFLDGIHALQELSERELRRRIGRIADGVYRATGWTEWGDEFYKIPCTLTIDGDHMLFDFEGASPQAPHFFNSKPYIVKSAMMMQFRHLVCPDLPYTEGLLAPVELRCPEGSVLNSTPPAPINAGHMHIALNAAETMMQCVRLALWASSPPLAGSAYVHGWNALPALGLTMWSGTGFDGTADTWVMMDGNWPGSPAGADRDGLDLSGSIVGPPSPQSTVDIEVLELWYPMLVLERRARPGVRGAGAHRAGGGADVVLQPYGTDALTGQMLGMHRWLPLEGAAGGYPGETTQFLLRRGGGGVEEISIEAASVALGAGDTFEFRCASGGGVGDPMDRDADAVIIDVAEGLIQPADALEIYGVVIDDEGAGDARATRRRRSKVLRERLAKAMAPARAVNAAGATRASAGQSEAPLYPGVVQRGPVAFALDSGTALAIAPDHWTDGCAVLEWRRAGTGPAITIRAYLDPVTGKALYVEAVPAGEPRAFEVSPRRWTTMLAD